MESTECSIPQVRVWTASRRKNYEITDMNFHLSNIIFPSFKGRFRFTSTVSVGGLTFVLEKISAPSRWSTLVTDLSKHGQAGTYYYNKKLNSSKIFRKSMKRHINGFTRLYLTLVLSRETIFSVLKVTYCCSSFLIT